LHVVHFTAMMRLQTIILAAGQGTRMNSARPKILHRIGGISLLEHVYRLAKQLSDNQVITIYGYGGEQILAELNYLETIWVEQKRQLGTGHAVMQVADRIDDRSTVLVLYGDVPLLRLETATRLIQQVSTDSLSLLTVELEDPSGYGRIVRGAENQVLRIVEEKDASAEEKLIPEVNTGIVATRGDWLKRWLRKLDNNNAQGEFYLTDIVALAVADGIAIKTVTPACADEVKGINNRQQLAHAERVYQCTQATRLMERGVTLLDPHRFDLRGQILEIGQDVEMDIDVILEGRLRIGSNVKIGPYTAIRDSEIGDDVEIMAHCIIENSIIGPSSRVGPFARLRPETQLAEDVHVGNFVEIKKSTVAKHSKINHLSYIGDCTIGSAVNIGAGTITCNYDGANKHQTVIEDGAFIGSDTQLVAPVKVAKNATIGAGSTITRDAPENSLTLSRCKQVSVEGWRRPEKKRS
jgi:bifunctional UDP-N-acetylglucosamine pyrophosphorylase/glucosamine-1-phosphate N-acetyltransferase